jgi:hypothetical protein
MAVKGLLTGLYDVGVYVGYPGASTYDSSLSQYVATVGTAPGYVDIFIDDTQAMSQWVTGAQAEAGELAASTDGGAVIPVVGVPLISTVSDGLTELQNFAAITSGADDSTWLGIVQAYEAQGYTTIDLRLGEEENVNEYPWSISTTAEAQAYISAFDHISALVHSVSGITVNVIWDPSTVTTSAVPTEATYPGNAYVDIIGVDAYDSVYPLSLYDWSTHTVDATLAQWEANPVNLEHYWNYPDGNVYYPTGTGQGFGLADAIAFAKANGKPLALTETGAGGASASPSADDALFPQYLATTLLSSGVQIAFANIWDSGNYTFSNGSKPNEAAAWASFVQEIDQDASPLPAAVISGYYQAILGRSADTAGLAGWVADVNSGMTYAQVEADFANSAEAQTDITNLYEAILGRAPDPAGLTAFTQYLATGGSLAGGRTVLADSVEAQTDITNLYQAILGRAPDPAGLMAFTQYLATGGSLAGGSVVLADSTEAQNDITNLYEAVLGRAPDPAGLTAFTQYLATAGSLAGGRIVLADCAEAQADVTTLLQKDTGMGPTAAAVAAGQTQLVDGLSLTDLNTQTLNLAANPASFLGLTGGTTSFTGSGAALFGFGPGSFGQNTIVGFNPAKDILELSPTQFPTLSAVQADLSQTINGALITLDSSDTILLSGVATSSLVNADYRFV